MSSSNYEYSTGTVTVTGTTGVQKISIILASSNFSWSTGAPGTGGTGIKLSSTNGTVVPVSSFSVNGSNMVVQTAGDGSTTASFIVTTYIAASNNPDTMYIMADSDPGVTVTFQFPGQDPATLSQTKVGLPWPGNQ
jgi:hypothetical protein